MIEVLKPGLHTSIQDLGRFGYRNMGVPIGGCMDAISANLANSLLGNSESDALIEITLMGPELLFQMNSVIAISGAFMSPKINDEVISNDKAYHIKNGDILSFGKLVKGMRSYIAIKNGIKSDFVLNSRSQFNNITKKIRLEKGDQLRINAIQPNVEISIGTVKNSIQFYETNEIEVQFGPEFNIFSKKEMDKLINQMYTVSKNNDRMGYQMEETVLKNSISMITGPVLPGTVQLLPSGKIIILMKDAQTTGGYLRMFQLTAIAISILAQKKVGDTFKLKLSPTVTI